MSKRLVVSLPARTVGALTQNRGGLVQWVPDSGWESHGQEPRLGLDFLRTRGPRSHASDLPAWFENLLPEKGSELRARLCELHGLRDGQSFALMRALGRDLIGAATVREDTAFDAELAPGPIGSTATDDNEQANGSLERLSALTGMQLKFSMSMVSERLVLPARAGLTQWIVKIAGREYDELAEVEAATMTWARLAGFDVPEHFTVPVTQLAGIPEGWIERDAAAFAIRRFDRRDDGSRVHQEDVCQALGLRPQDKYSNSDSDPRRRVTFEGVLRLVTDVCGEDGGRELARRIGFMIASGNTDAHLKNWSLLWGERTRPTLTPSYDLVATISWPNMGWKKRGGPALALKLGGERQFRALREAVLDLCAKRSGAPWVAQEVKAGIQRARDTWPHVRALAPERMRSALEEHWQEVPLLADAGPLA